MSIKNLTERWDLCVLNNRRIVIILFFVSCGIVTIVFFLRHPICIDSITERMLELSGVDGCKMIHFGGYNSIEKTSVKISISDRNLKVLEKW